ncbi:MAG: MBL fold metallo-hydrolase [Dehalococcoidia bacterium]|nr:MBL fold metallo-hydrolase [Dehalococcoidia bacterium]
MKSLRIGNVEVLPLLDTALLMNPRQFLPEHADQFLAEYGHEADSRGLLPMAVTCFLLRSAGKTLLVDTGLGGRRRPGFPQGRLDQSLAEAGVDPADVETVLNTHLHIDHVGWNTVEDEAGKSRVFFPKARFVIQQREWEHWMRPQFLDEPGNAHLVQCVVPLEREGRVDLVSGEQPVDEHITFIATPGHTPGHVAIGVASAGERAVIIGDASHHPVQLAHPDWSPAFDSDPVQSAQTRDRLFEMAIAEERIWIAGHWAHPGVGRIVRLEGKRFFQAR